MLKHQTLSLEVRSVDAQQRLIEGYANVFGVTDSYGTRWTPDSFARTIRESGTQVKVFEGHDVSRLPVGKPVEMRIDEHGLFTRTLISPGTDGDNVLAKARFFQEQGQPIGMSVGFRERASHLDGKVLVFDDVDLREYSFVAFEAVPGSQVTAVRADGEPEDPHVLLRRAAESLIEAANEIELRVNAARTLELSLRDQAMTDMHMQCLSAAMDLIQGVMSSISGQPMPAEADDTARSVQPDPELNRSELVDQWIADALKGSTHA